MPDLLRQTYPVARKDHDCMASDFINANNGFWGELYTFSELREIVKARQNGWKVLKGERYIRQSVLGDGRLYTFKAIPAMHDICLKYDMYEV